jgi:hypothetical protein
MQIPIRIGIKLFNTLFGAKIIVAAVNAPFGYGSGGIDLRPADRVFYHDLPPFISGRSTGTGMSR